MNNPKVLHKRIDEQAQNICNNICKYKKENTDISAICEGCPVTIIQKIVKNNYLEGNGIDVLMRRVHEETGLSFTTINMLMSGKYDKRLCGMTNILCEDFSANENESLLQALFNFINMPGHAFRKPHAYSLLAAIQDVLYRVYGEIHVELEPDISSNIGLCYQLNDCIRIYGFENGKRLQADKIVSIPRDQFKITGKGILWKPSDMKVVSFDYNDLNETWAFNKKDLWK